MKFKNYIVVTDYRSGVHEYEIYDNEQEALKRVDNFKMLGVDAEVQRWNLERNELPVDYDALVKFSPAKVLLLKNGYSEDSNFNQFDVIGVRGKEIMFNKEYHVVYDKVSETFKSLPDAQARYFEILLDREDLDIYIVTRPAGANDDTLQNFGSVREWLDSLMCVGDVYFDYVLDWDSKDSWAWSSLVTDSETVVCPFLKDRKDEAEALYLYLMSAEFRKNRTPSREYIIKEGGNHKLRLHGGVIAVKNDSKDIGTCGIILDNVYLQRRNKYTDELENVAQIEFIDAEKMGIRYKIQ